MEKTYLQVSHVRHQEVYVIDHGLNINDRVIADVKRDNRGELALERGTTPKLLYETLPSKQCLHIVRAQIKNLNLCVILFKVAKDGLAGVDVRRSAAKTRQIDSFKTDVSIKYQLSVRLAVREIMLFTRLLGNGSSRSSTSSSHYAMLLPRWDCC